MELEDLFQQREILVAQLTTLPPLHAERKRLVQRIAELDGSIRDVIANAPPSEPAAPSEPAP